ncbi:MAG: pilus assembly protein TadG-related protein [Pseudomonadota bacterium]
MSNSTDPELRLHARVFRSLCDGAVHRARKLASSRKGNVSIIFGLMAVPFISFAGVSIDFAAATREKSRIQVALDAAALAAGRQFQVSGSETEAKAAAALYFEKQTGYQLTVNTVDPGTFVLTVGSQENVPTSFMGVLGSKWDQLTVNALAKAQLVRERQGDKVEVGMMLDVTGSMSWGIPGQSGSRMSHLRAAAKDLVNIIIEDGDNNVRVGLAPFARAVKLPESVFIKATNKQPGSHTCVVERTGNNKFKDKKPNNGNGWFNVYGYASQYCPSAELVPLTSNKSTLISAIDNLPTSGSTAGHLGTQWAWYLVSKKMRKLYAGPNKPANTSNGVKKIVVLMSDGEYNRAYHNGESSDAQADQICDQMKSGSNAVIVYSVGFALRAGSQAYNTLKECATNDAHFFPAADGADLRAAFRSIAFNIAELRLVE